MRERSCEQSSWSCLLTWILSRRQAIEGSAEGAGWVRTASGWVRVADAGKALLRCMDAQYRELGAGERYVVVSKDAELLAGPSGAARAVGRKVMSALALVRVRAAGRIPDRRASMRLRAASNYSLAGAGALTPPPPRQVAGDIFQVVSSYSYDGMWLRLRDVISTAEGPATGWVPVVSSA